MCWAPITSARTPGRSFKEWRWLCERVPLKRTLTTLSAYTPRALRRETGLGLGDRPDMTVCLCWQCPVPIHALHAWTLVLRSLLPPSLIAAALSQACMHPSRCRCGHCCPLRSSPLPCRTLACTLCALHCCPHHCSSSLLCPLPCRSSRLWRSPRDPGRTLSARDAEDKPAAVFWPMATPAAGLGKAAGKSLPRLRLPSFSIFCW